MFSPLDEINDWKLHTIMTTFKKIAWKYMNNNTKLILKNQEIIMWVETSWDYLLNCCNLSSHGRGQVQDIC